jgi:hypothetical protein
MSRATLILGFALLVIAATLAATITLRNAPGDNRMVTRPDAGTPRTAQPHALSHTRTTGSTADSNARNSRSQANHKVDSLKEDSLSVVLPEPWLTDLPTTQQAEWRTRTAAVERAARKKLDRLTTDLDLTPAQCDKMFPLIVRSTPGYDPVMFVGGSLTPKTSLAAAAYSSVQLDGTSNITPKTSLAADEEMHQVLDPHQQALVENQEVNRQLWWQDTLARLEADLINSTGGDTPTITTTPTTPADAAPAAATPADAGPATEEPVAPESSETGNLFDLIESNP